MGDNLDELFAGTPSVIVVRVVLCRAVERWLGLMLLDVKHAFLYGEMKRDVYIELPKKDPRAGDERVLCKPKKAIYGTRDAPQIWADSLKNDVES